MSTAAQLFMTLNRLATVAEAPDEATRRNGISRDEFLSLLGIKTSAPGATLSEASERAFERAKQTLRDAGARITHFTTDTSGRYRLNAEAPDSLTAWNPTAEEFFLLNAELRGWEGTELQDEAYRILRKIALTSEHLTDEALTAANVTRIEEIKQRARDLHAYREHIQRLHFSDDPHLYELFTAYAQRKTLNFTYQGSGGDIKTYEKVSVAGLIYSYGSWYLVAHFPLGDKTPEERKTYTYRTDRIRSLDVFSSIDPAPINPARLNLFPEFGDGAASLTLLNYTRLTDTELAILVFTLSAADLMYSGDPRPAAILAALAEAYPRTADYAKHLLFAPEDPLLQDARAALASGRALTITYGTRAAERVVDPVALTLHRDRLYLHAWCRASEARHLATLSEDAAAESPAAEEAKPASAAGEKAASASAEPTPVEPVFWRNFRLTRISSYAPAGEAQPHYIGPNHDSTVNDWHAKQHKTTTNPSVDLRIHPTDHTPGGETLENLTATYKRRSAEHARKGTKTTHVRVHYNNIAGAGDKNIIDTVIAHRGSLEITGPAHLRAALLEHLTALANANPASPREN